MKITRRQLRRIIREDLIRSLDEARYTAGVRAGDVVWLKDDPDRGKGVVRGKYKHPQQGHLVQVQWERTGDSSLHIPSAITTSQETASKWSSGRIAPQARRPWNAHMGTGKPLPADWVQSYEKLKDEVSQWFTDRDKATQFLSDIQALGFKSAAQNWELDEEVWEEISQALRDRGYLNQFGGWKRPDVVNDPDDDSDDPQELGNMMADGDIYTNLVKFVARWFADDEEQANDFIQDMIKLGVDDAFLNSNLEPDSEYEIRSMLQTGGWMHAGDVFTGSQLPPDKLEQ